MNEDEGRATPATGTLSMRGFCTACGAALLEQARFCAQCETEIGVSPPRRPRPPAWAIVLTVMALGLAGVALYAHFATNESGLRGGKWFDMPLYPGAQVATTTAQGDAIRVAALRSDDSTIRATAWYRDTLTAAGMVLADRNTAIGIFGQTVELYEYRGYIYGVTVAADGTQTIIGLMRVDPARAR